MPEPPRNADPLLKNRPIAEHGIERFPILWAQVVKGFMPITNRVRHPAQNTALDTRRGSVERPNALRLFLPFDPFRAFQFSGTSKKIAGSEPARRFQRAAAFATESACGPIA